MAKVVSTNDDTRVIAKETFDAVILGAGPSGLTAAYKLARGGARVAVLERAGRTGGLMAGIRRGGFTFDIGRKELYCRLQDVHDLWSELLGDDYRPYAHRAAWLFGGNILERTAGPRGPLRGMSPEQAARLALSFLWSQVRPGSRLATNLEDYYILRYGQAFYDYYVRGYRSKFDGISPRTLGAPFGDETIPRFGFVQSRLARLFGKEQGASRVTIGPDAAPEPGAPAVEESAWRQDVWRHPARGTLQIVEGLESGARAAGAVFYLNADVRSVEIDGSAGHRVVVHDKRGRTEITAKNLVSSIPRPLFMKLLRPAPPPELAAPPKKEAVFKKSVLLVYLMANEEPRFPHNWLQVTDMSLHVGRIVNYATWNGAMVPRGKTGLCLEYFCDEGDRPTKLDDAGLFELALNEAADSGLIGRDRVFDHFIVRLPNTNAATELTHWKIDWMQRVQSYMAELPRVYDTNRPGMDYATLAGIDAAAACATGAPMSQRSLASVHGGGD